MNAFEKTLKEYEILLSYQKTSLIVSPVSLKWYKEHGDIRVGKKQINRELLERLLSDEDYYYYVKLLFSNKISDLTINCIKDSELSKEAITLTKVDIVNGINICLKENKFVLKEKEMQRYQEISEQINFKSFINKMSDKFYTLDIDGDVFRLKVSDILNFLNCSNEDYEAFFDLKQRKNIFGMPKDKFVFLVVKFVDDYDIFSNYLVPDNVIQRCNELASSKKIDIEAINEILKTHAPNLEKVEIDSELKNEILDGMPKDVSDLEKSAYIYIKMCKLLTYDDEFYAFNLEGSVSKKHEDINNLKNITLKNNKVVCYEFNAIFAKILDELGIKFEMNVNPYHAFGGGHANLDFRDGKFLVRADSVTSILEGDLLNAKLNQSLNGFYCLNKNDETQEEFKEKVSKMYKLVIEQEKKKNDKSPKIEVKKKETFDDIISEYRTKTKIKHIGLEEKFQIMLDKVSKEKHLFKMDVLSYFLQLKKIIFSAYEQQKNISFSIIRKNMDTNSATVNAIFTLNERNINEDFEQNRYYVHDGYQMQPISKKELENLFLLKIFDYISDEDPKIPGIKNTTNRGK